MLTDISTIIADHRPALFGHVRHLLPDVSAHDVLQVTVNMLSGTVPSQERNQKRENPDILGFGKLLQTVTTQCRCMDHSR